MPIEQHPIPQDVAGYKFRLIGDMTVKQFIWLAGGIILGLISYSLPLPFFFKYPLTGLFVGLGAGIAFLPIEGRPMDKWLIAFIKSVYSPTQYTWQKSTGQTSPTIMTAKKITPPPIVTTSIVSPTSTPIPTPQTPTLAITPPKTVSIPETPVIAPAPRSAQHVDPSVVLVKEEKPAPTPSILRSTAVLSPAPSRTPFWESHSGRPTTSVTAAPAPSGNLPVPFTPTSPNTLVGMTLTPDGKILDGCLIEIKTGGNSIRATKSNQLGQFLFAKPLENGNYHIFTEKPGFIFDSYSLALTGQIVKPLRLQAKAHA